MLKIEELGDPAQLVELAKQTKEGGLDLRWDIKTSEKMNQPQGEGHEVRVISRLATGQKNPNRVNVFVNHTYAFSLDIAQVVDFKLKVGLQLSAEQEKELKDASEFGKLYQNALEWALMRPRSVREAETYFRNCQRRREQLNRARESREQKALPNIQSETIKLVKERLIERGYLDDEKFAEYFVENRRTKKGASRRRLEQELRLKGITDELIQRVLDKSGRDEGEELKKLLAKKRRTYDDDKLMRYLVQQGFSYQQVKEAIEEAKGTE